MIVVLDPAADVAGGIYLRSRKTAVSHDNVNDEWAGPSRPSPRTASV